MLTKLQSAQDTVFPPVQVHMLYYSNNIHTQCLQNVLTVTKVDLVPALHLFQVYTTTVGGMNLIAISLN